eukprot:1542431-Prymnesium_polylepis.1
MHMRIAHGEYAVLISVQTASTAQPISRKHGTWMATQSRRERDALAVNETIASDQTKLSVRGQQANVIVGV